MSAPESMKRYDVKTAQIRNPDDPTYGDFVLYHEAHAIEQERDALKAEVVRLTALLGPQKILRAEEVTEPGWYRWREDKESPWRSVEVDIDADGDVNVWVTGSDIPYYGNEWGVPYGEFYGPLKDPEV